MGKATGHTITSDSALGAAKIQRSLRFDNENNTYLNRTPSSQGDRRVFTLSWWMKCDRNKTLFSAQRSTLNPSLQINIDDQRLVVVGNKDGSSSSYMMSLVTDAQFRDKGAWYHCVVAFNTNDGTASNRIKIYVNGSQITSFSAGSTGLTADTYPSSGDQTSWGTNEAEQNIGRLYSGSGYYDGYLAEVHYVDGSQLTPDSFGFTDPQTGIWMPKRYEGGYGNVDNGFYLDFSDNSSTSALGIDKSPNGNDFSTNNFSVSAGYDNDSVLDTPTNNFNILSRLDYNSNANPINGGLQTNASATGGHYPVFTTLSIKSGKWYLEFDSEADGMLPSIMEAKHDGGSHNTDSTVGNNTSPVNKRGYGLLTGDGRKSHNGTYSSYGSRIHGAGGDVGMCAFDADNGKIYWGKNNTWFDSGNPVTGANPAFSGIDMTRDWLFAFHVYGNNNNVKVKFGSQGFTYTPPSGFKALSTKNLPPNVPSVIRPQKHFDTILYTGSDTSAARTVTGLEFAPDLVWQKRRNGTNWHSWFDTVRGVGKELFSNSNVEETTNNQYGYISSFNKDGFTWSPGSTNNSDGNESSGTFVSWCWKAGGAAVSNSDGSITSTISANQEAGFSIVTWTGTGSNSTVGHGLGKAPKVVICKLRDTTTQDWFFMPGEITGDRGKYIKFDTTDGVASDIHTFPPTATTSTVFTVGGEDGGNGSNGNGSKYVAYCWAEIPGYSKFDSYVGNGDADGQFVHLGFRPAWLLIRKLSGDHWIIKDSTRNTFNDVHSNLGANINNAEFGSTGNVQSTDFLSNGFKLRGTDGAVNGGSSDYIYMAFAEQQGVTPFDTFPNAR